MASSLLMLVTLYIWVTAAIGILIGIGFYMPAAAATVLTIAALTVMRWVEERMPAHAYAHHVPTFARENVMPEDEVRDLLKAHHFKIVNLSYRTAEDGQAVGQLTDVTGVIRRRQRAVCAEQSLQPPLDAIRAGRET